MAKKYAKKTKRSRRKAPQKPRGRIREVDHESEEVTLALPVPLTGNVTSFSVMNTSRSIT